MQLLEHLREKKKVLQPIILRDIDKKICLIYLVQPLKYYWTHHHVSVCIIVYHWSASCIQKLELPSAFGRMKQYVAAS